MRNKVISVVAGAALVLGLTTGCQATPPDITEEKAAQLQSQVLAITSAVADGGYAAALDALTALQTELDAAAADGSLSFARHQRIEAAMAAVRADIQAAIDAQAVPTPAPSEPEETTAPVEQQPTPDTETDAEKKAREAAEKAAEDAAKKAEQEAKKAADEAKKKAEEDAKKATETPQPSEEPQGKKGNG